MVKYAVAPLSEFPPGTRKVVILGGRPIAIFNVKGEFFALLNRCPHRGAALSHGELMGFVSSPEPGCYVVDRMGEILRCPWHGWEFDIRTGQSWFDPEHTKVRMYHSDVTSGAKLVEGPYKAETFEVSLEEDYVVVEV
jgi:3-phenylpropionate/trans-cinnamate dioxygenase ferredoxin subunit